MNDKVESTHKTRVPHHKAHNIVKRMGQNVTLADTVNNNITWMNVTSTS